MELPPSRAPSARVRRRPLEQPSDRFADAEEVKVPPTSFDLLMAESDPEDDDKGEVQDDPEYKAESSSVSDLPSEVREHIKALTNNYDHTYAEIKSHPNLAAPPLKRIPLELIKRHIRLSRDAIRRASAKNDAQLGEDLVKP